MSTDLAVIEAALKGDAKLLSEITTFLNYVGGRPDSPAAIHDRGNVSKRIIGTVLAHELIAELVERVKAAEAEVERLARWQSDALPVMDGLQELGRTLGLILGDSITGPKAHAAAEALKSRAESAEATIARVRELAYESDDGTEFKHDHGPLEGHPGCPACWAHDLLAALSGPESAPESPSSPFPAPEDAPAPAEPSEPILRPTDQRYEPPADRLGL